MKIVTTGRDGKAVKKAFAWSYSKLKNYESCPKRHYHIDVAKDVKEEESEQLSWGNDVHKALADRIAKGTELPYPMRSYEHWVERILKTPGELLVEQKLAITEDFSPCTFFDGKAWYRAVGDVIKINGPVALIADWKTGKILEDSVQLALSAACVFAHYPSIKMVRSEFIWLKEDASSRVDMGRADMPGMWKGLWPRIEALKHAHETNEYPAKPGFLCKKWCPVSKCPHYGE
jgi:hypothetical protein